MSLLWNPWVAMGIVAVLAVICAWIESKRKPVHERIKHVDVPPMAGEVVLPEDEGFEVTNTEVAPKPSDNTSEQKRKRKQRQNRRRRNRSRN